MGGETSGNVGFRSKGVGWRAGIHGSWLAGWLKLAPKDAEGLDGSAGEYRTGAVTSLAVPAGLPSGLRPSPPHIPALNSRPSPTSSTLAPPPAEESEYETEEEEGEGGEGEWVEDSGGEDGGAETASEGGASDAGSLHEYWLPPGATRAARTANAAGGGGGGAYGSLYDSLQPDYWAPAGAGVAGHYEHYDFPEVRQLQEQYALAAAGLLPNPAPGGAGYGNSHVYGDGYGGGYVAL